MSSWEEFWHMGGYAVYVWSAYAIAFAILGANVVVPIVWRKRLERHLKHTIQSQERQT